MTSAAIDFVRGGDHGPGLDQGRAAQVRYRDLGYLIGILGGGAVFHRCQGNAVGLEMVVDQLHFARKAVVNIGIGQI